jgi:hypothetical protein
MEYLARFGPVIAVTGVMVLVVRCLDHLFRTHVWRQEEKKAPDHVIQMVSADGCVYIYDVDKKTLKKVYDIEKQEDIPDDVKAILAIAGLHVNFEDI